MTATAVSIRDSARTATRERPVSSAATQAAASRSSR